MSKKKPRYSKYFSRKYISGRVVEEIVFRLPEDPTAPPPRRSAKERAHRVQTKHDKSLVNKATRLIHCNFGSEDYFVTLTYGDAEHAKLEIRAAAISERTGQYEIETPGLGSHSLYEAGRQDLTNWLRRVKYKCAKLGIEFKYFATTSDMGVEAGEERDVRVHHHVIINAEARDIAVACWRSENVKTTRLWAEQTDRTPLLKYMLEQVRHYTDEKAYKPSRNLATPEIDEKPVSASYEPKVPRWATVVYRAEWLPGRAQYVRYILPETPVQKNA
ncbi:MAG: hypothetical protein LBN00_03815 [Oscillospiraceae bacterium]|nr:hypothetical protein [Oscillospiraceae bacterium]